MKRFLGITTLLSMYAAASAEACTVCMGDPTSNVAGAANGAIFVMLGVLAVILGSIATFIVYLARRANRPLPPEFQLTQNFSSGSQSGIPQS